MKRIRLDRAPDSSRITGDHGWRRTTRPHKTSPVKLPKQWESSQKRKRPRPERLRPRETSNEQKKTRGVRLQMSRQQQKPEASQSETSTGCFSST